MTSTTFRTVFDENDGILKNLPLDDNTLVPVTSDDAVEKYDVSAGGGAFAVGRRSLVSGSAIATSAPNLKTTRRAEGSVTWSGSGDTLAVTITGVAATDEVYAEIIGEPTEAANLLSAVATTNTVTFTLSAANTSNDAVITYAVYA